VDESGTFLPELSYKTAVKQLCGRGKCCTYDDEDMKVLDTDWFALLGNRLGRNISPALVLPRFVEHTRRYRRHLRSDRIRLYVSSQLTHYRLRGQKRYAINSAKLAWS